MADKTRSREREPDAEASDTRFYEPKVYEYLLDELDRAANGRIVVRAKDRLWDVHRQANSKRYLSQFEPDLQDTATHWWEVFLQNFAERSGKHRHQGGLVIFILEGKGHTIIDGERHEWMAGDLMLLPFVPGGVEHQHFNHDPNVPSKWIGFVYYPYKDIAGSESTQLETSPIYDRWLSRQTEGSKFAHVEKRRAPQPELASAPSTTNDAAALAPAPSASPAFAPSPLQALTKFDRLFAIRDEQRALRRAGRKIVPGTALPWEESRNGRLKWYMHPDMVENCLNSLLFYVQELAPMGRSGKVKSQGGHAGVVWEGRGYTLVDGVRHDWEKHDVLNFPVRTKGLVLQHVNLDPEKPALLAFVEPNTVDALGVDRGCGFELVEEAPK